MSIHLESVPLSLGTQLAIANAEDVTQIPTNSRDDFKISTNIRSDDYDLMQRILEKNLLGFKSKTAYLNFRDSGDMIFDHRGDTIVIYFLNGYYAKNAIVFVNNLCREYSKITGEPLQEINMQHEVEEPVEETKREIVETKKPVQLESEVDVAEEVEPVVEEKPKFKIHTNMKNMEIMNNIMDESYLGFNSKEEVEAFKNKGEIMTSINGEGTYDLVFIGDYDKQQAKSYVDNLTDEYKSKVQEMTYEKVMEKIKEKNYSVESEVVDNQDSIVLTLNV